MRRYKAVLFSGLCLALVSSVSASANGPPVFDSSVRYLCQGHGQPAFDSIHSSGCSVVPREAGWETVLFSPNIIIDVHPASIVRDGDTVKLWVRMYLSQAYPYETTSGQSKGTYDGLKGVYKLFCHKRQQEIVQADYLNGEKPIYYRLSDEAIVEEIEPGTAIETVYDKYCAR